MSVEDRKSIDFISYNQSLGLVTLTISDPIDWISDPNHHIVLLQEKIESYLTFIESQEFLSRYPQYKGFPLRIEVVGKFPLSKYAGEFFKYAEGFVTDAGIAFSFRLFHKEF